MSEEKQQKKNVPELRFPEFSGEWKLEIFGNLVSNKSKKYKPSREEHLRDIELDSIESDSGRLIKVYDSSTQKSQKSIFNEGKVLYSKLRPYLNKYLFPTFPGVCSSEIWVLDSKHPEALKNKFLYYFIQTSRYFEAANKSAGSKMPRADWELVSNIKLVLPSIIEQQKIGTFFSKLDQQIELEEKKLALLEEQKNGYMQKIFSQELRFKDENGNEYPEWEEVTIADITSCVSSKKSSNQYNENESAQGYPVYDAIREIGKDPQYDMETPYISILKDGAGVGRLNLRQGQSSVIGTMSYLLPHNSEIKFLYYRMKLLDFKKYIIGSTIPHLYYKDYSKERVSVPTMLEEQEKIGRFVFKLDELINDKSKKIESLKLRKRGLLQKIFV